MDLTVFFEIPLPWPGGVRGAIESAAPVPGCRACRTKSRNSGIQEPDRLRTLCRTLPKLARTRFKILKMSILLGSIFGAIFRTPIFGHRAALEAHQKESQSPPAAPWEVPGR